MSSFVVGCKKNKINNIKHIKNYNNITSCNSLSTICGAVHTICEAFVLREKHECTKIPDMTIPNKFTIHYIFKFRFRSKLTSEKDICTHEIGQITVAFCSTVVNNLLSFFRRGLERKASISSYCGLRWV